MFLARLTPGFFIEPPRIRGPVSRVQLSISPRRVLNCRERPGFSGGMRRHSLEAAVKIAARSLHLDFLLNDPGRVREFTIGRHFTNPIAFKSSEPIRHNP